MVESSRNVNHLLLEIDDGGAEPVIVFPFTAHVDSNSSLSELIGPEGKHQTLRGQDESM